MAPFKVESIMPVLSAYSSSMRPEIRVPLTTVRNSMARGRQCGTLRPQASRKPMAVLTVTSSC